ncbi:MAG: hypothetical protein WAR83_01185 [Flavobacteriales bacterium]
MISIRTYNVQNKSLTAVLSLLLQGGIVSAQPYCDILLRPAFDVSFNGNVITCSNLSTPLTAGTTELWSYGDATVSDSYAYHEYTTLGVYPVCLTLSTQDGACSSTYCRDVFVPENDCNGSWNSTFSSSQTGTNTLTLTDISTSGTPDSRQWGFGDLSAVSTDESPSHTWLLPGSHLVHLTRRLGECVVTDAHWVTVDGNASTCGQDLFVNFTSEEMGGQVVFQSELTSLASIPVIALWSYGDGLSDTTFASTHTYAEPGEYQTCLFVGATNLSSFDTCFAFVCRTITVGASLVGVTETEQHSLNVWPVPFQNELHLSAPWLSGTCIARLTDATGREIHRSQQHVTERMDLNLPDLRSGAYVLEVNSVLGSKRTLLIRD